MTITHQTVLGEDGKPTAALIPWEQFEALRDLLSASNEGDEVSPEWRDEINRRVAEIDSGDVELIDGEGVIRRAREAISAARTK